MHKPKLQIGQDQKVVFAGNSLNGDTYHTVIFRRRKTKLTIQIDDDDPVIGNIQILYRDAESNVLL